MKVADKIYELVKTLPEEQASQVLMFVESLQQATRVQVEGQTVARQSETPLSDFVGILKDSPNFNQDPVALQRKLRDEWN
ncbi:DUF2281 domain-containing protein [Cyanobacteria bacterium FACHB-DQ100]|nr:DUF2281 domain-containing protein [Cyanobacteria bacterium FACHB-DQ100]